MIQTAEQKADALLLSIIFPERFPMPQTDTPLTDAVWNELEHYEPISALANELYDLARRLERDLAKANADRAVLVARLEECLTGVTEEVFDKARAALSQVQAHEDGGVCPYCNKSCATVVDVALHVQAQHAHEA